MSVQCKTYNAGQSPEDVVLKIAAEYRCIPVPLEALSIWHQAVHRLGLYICLGDRDGAPMEIAGT